MLSVLRPPFSVLQTVSINSTSEEVVSGSDSFIGIGESSVSINSTSEEVVSSCHESHTPSSMNVPFPLIRLPKKL